MSEHPLERSDPSHILAVCSDSSGTTRRSRSKPGLCRCRWYHRPIWPIRCVEPCCRCSVAVEFSWIERRRQHARKAFSVALPAVPADALSCLEHFDQFGDHEHAREVNIEAGEALQIAIEIDRTATIMVSASTPLTRRIERGNNDVNRQGRRINSSEPRRGLRVVILASGEDAIGTALPVRAERRIVLNDEVGAVAFCNDGIIESRSS